MTRAALPTGRQVAAVHEAAKATRLDKGAAKDANEQEPADFRQLLAKLAGKGEQPRAHASHAKTPLADLLAQTQDADDEGDPTQLANTPDEPADGSDPSETAAATLLNLLNASTPMAPTTPPVTAGAGQQIQPQPTPIVPRAMEHSAPTQETERIVPPMPAATDETPPPINARPVAQNEQTASVATVSIVGQERHLAVTAAPKLKTLPVADKVEGDEAAAKPSGSGSSKPVPPQDKSNVQRPAQVVDVSRAQDKPADRGDRGSAEPPSRKPDATNATTQPKDTVALEDSKLPAQAVAAASKEAPPTAGPPIQQVATRIVAALSGSDAPVTVGQQLPTSTDPQTSGMVKVLTIQLQPAELGSIAVRMALNNDTIELQIEAGRPETAGLLQRDRDKLSDILRSAGYQVDGVMVRVVHRDAVTPAGQSAQAFLGGSDQGQAGSSQGDASPFQRHGHEQRQLPQHGNASRNGRDEESRDPSRTGGGIYV